MGLFQASKRSHPSGSRKLWSRKPSSLVSLLAPACSLTRSVLITSKPWAPRPAWRGDG